MDFVCNTKRFYCRFAVCYVLSDWSICQIFSISIGILALTVTNNKNRKKNSVFSERIHKMNFTHFRRKSIISHQFFWMIPMFWPVVFLIIFFMSNKKNLWRKKIVVANYIFVSLHLEEKKIYSRLGKKIKRQLKCLVQMVILIKV